MKTTPNIPANLAASTARARQLAESLGIDVASEENRARDLLAADQEALRKLGAPKFDCSADWAAMGLTARERNGLKRYVRRLADLDESVVEWYCACRAATAAMFAELVELGVGHDQALAEARQVVIEVAYAA